MFKKFRKWLGPLVGVLIVILVVGAVSAVLASILVSHNIGGIGTITVTTTPALTPPTFDFSINTASPIDFSGGANQNQSGAYIREVDVSVTNTGIDGTNGGAPATINSFTASLESIVSGWPSGADISGSVAPSGGVVKGGTAIVPVTLTIPASDLTGGNITLPAFTIVITAN